MTNFQYYELRGEIQKLNNTVKRLIGVLIKSEKEKVKKNVKQRNKNPK